MHRYESELDCIGGISRWLMKAGIPASFFAALLQTPNTTMADYLLKRKAMPRIELLQADKIARNLSRLIQLSRPLPLSTHTKDAAVVRRLLDGLETGDLNILIYDGRDEKEEPTTAANPLSQAAESFSGLRNLS